jgi:hypothetical protein
MLLPRQLAAVGRTRGGTPAQANACAISTDSPRNGCTSSFATRCMQFAVTKPWPKSRGTAPSVTAKRLQILPPHIFFLKRRVACSRRVSALFEGPSLTHLALLRINYRAGGYDDSSPLRSPFHRCDGVFSRLASITCIGRLICIVASRTLLVQCAWRVTWHLGYK